MFPLLLSNAALSLILPYQVSIDVELNLYYFTTDGADTYYCRFREITNALSPLLGVYDLEIYEFEFYATNIGVFDARIAETICQLVTDFFENELRVMVYLCDGSDGRHKERSILFERWHRHYMRDFLNREPLDLEVANEAGDFFTNHGCILTRTDFPHPDILQRELIANAHDLVAHKYNAA